MTDRNVVSMKDEIAVSMLDENAKTIPEMKLGL